MEYDGRLIERRTANGLKATEQLNQKTKQKICKMRLVWPVFQYFTVMQPIWLMSSLAIIDINELVDQWNR